MSDMITTDDIARPMTAEAHRAADALDKEHDGSRVNVKRRVVMLYRVPSVLDSLLLIESK